jgi:S1-C subfamily serine protease
MSRRTPQFSTLVHRLFSTLRPFVAGTMVVAALAAAPAALPAAQASGGLSDILSVEPATNGTLPQTEIAKRLCHAAVWIIAGEWTGSGWLLDAERGLVMTNQHVVTDMREVQVYFPDFRDGRIVTDRSYYLNHVIPMVGTVLDADVGCDLALVQVDRVPDHAVALPLAAEGTQQAERVHTLGGNPKGSDGMWIYTSGNVRQVYETYLGNGGYAQAIEYDMPTNPGNSGGAVVNDRGEVVGVHEAGHPDAQDVCLGVDLSPLRNYLNTVLPLVEPQSAEQFLARGQRNVEQGRSIDAVEDFSAALRLESECAPALVHRGWALIAQRELSLAIADFDKAIQLDPTSGAAYRGRGLAHGLQGNVDAALADLAEALRLSGGAQDAYWESVFPAAIN